MGFADFEISLDNFNGPLDLLLQLLRKHKLEISEVSIAEITEQYSRILRKMQEMNLDIAGDYFVMASTLMLMKAKSLIPREKEAFEEMKEQLIFKLEEYEKISKQAEILAHKKSIREKMFERGFKEDFAKGERPLVVSDNGAFLLGNMYAMLLRRLKSLEPVAVKKARYSMKEVVARIYEVFRNRKKYRFFEFVKGYDKSYVVYSFSSVLELIKENILKGVQTSTFSEIILLKDKNFSYSRREEVISRYE